LESLLEFEPTTLTRAQLDAALEQAVHHPHGNVHKGKLVLSPEVFQSPGRETNLLVSRFAYMDLTGSIQLGAWCNISARCRIYTHDHMHAGRRPLLEVEEQHGVMWQDKLIGNDVWIHDEARILYQVTQIPDGVVIGAGAVLTRNPGPYEIWGGVPARKIGEREALDPAEEMALAAARRYRLPASAPQNSKAT
jgi:carbonic anhydrase/acetyltransferase-like protein (isoleucine patch superfamily)